MPIKILVFESDVTFAEQLRSGFAALGGQTTVVDDANLGLQAASRERPDLILLSIELPRMNGFSVCNKLKRDPALKEVPLIIMSSDSTEETFEQHRRLRTRAEDYLHKPISFEDLLARIQPFVRIDDSNAASKASDDTVSDDAIVLDDDIEIEAEIVDAPEVEAADHGGNVDQDMNDFADQAFGALEVAPPSIPFESEVLMDEPEIHLSHPPEGEAPASSGARVSSVPAGVPSMAGKAPEVLLDQAELDAWLGRTIQEVWRLRPLPWPQLPKSSCSSTISAITP